MADLATLGVEMDTTSVKAGIQTLNQVPPAADKAAAAADKLTKKVKESTSATQKQEEEQKKIIYTLSVVSRNASTLGSTFADMAKKVIGLNTSTKQLKTELINVTSELNHVGDSATRAGAAFSRIANASSLASINKIRATFADTGIAVNTASKEVEQLVNRMNRIKREDAFKQLAQDANLSNLQMAKLRYSMGDIGGAFRSLGQFGLAAKTGILAAGVAVVAFGKSCLDAQIEMERLEVAYSAVFGPQAQARLQAVYEQANKVGLNFQEAAKAAKGFFAAGQGTSLEGELQKIFNSITDAGAALQLSTDEMNGALVALGQMISKGKVQAEELRGQLGERLPGAFSMAAKAMGMTTAELDKFMADGKLTAEDLLPKLADALEKRYGEAAKRAADTVQGSINQMETEWFRFKASVLESGPIVFAVKFVTEGLKELNEANAKLQARKKQEDLLRKHNIQPAETNTYWDKDLKANVTVGKFADAQLAMSGAVLTATNMMKEGVEKALKDMDIAEEKYVADRRKRIDTLMKGDSEYKTATKRASLEKDINFFKEDNLRLQSKGIELTKAEQAQIDENNKSIASAQKQITELEKKAAKAGASGAAAAKRAAVSQADYAGEIEQTQTKIESLQQQLGLDRTENLTAKKIKIEEQYQTAISKTNEQIAKRVAQGSMTAAQGEELKKQKELEASLEKQLALKKLEEKQTQKNVQLAEGQIKFYKELGSLSGNYGNSISLQNKLLERQANEYRNVYDISEELVEQWLYLKKLEISEDSFDGAYRGLLKYKTEIANAAKDWESLTYNFAKSFTSQTRTMFDDFLDSGKLSLDGFKSLFKQFLKDLLWQAAMQPIMVSIVGGVTGMFGGGGTAIAGTGGNGLTGGFTGPVADSSGNIVGSVSNGVVNMGSKYAMNQLMGGGSGSLFSGITNTINSTMANWFPSMFAANSTIAASNKVVNAASVIQSQLTGAPASTLGTTTFTSALAPASIGAGIGAFASPYVNSLLGLQNNTGSSVGSLIGGGLGTLGGAMIAASSIPVAGWIGGGVAALGALLGGGVGSLFGGGQKQEPKLEIDLNAALWNPLGELLDTSTGSGASLKSGSSGGYWLGVETTKGASGQVGMAAQFGELAQQIHQQSWNIANSLGEVDESLKSQYLSNLQAQGVINQHAVHRGEYINEEQVQQTLDAFINNSMGAMLNALNGIDLTPLTIAADGAVADTVKELSTSFTKIFDFVNTSAVIEDEDRREQFLSKAIGQMSNALQNVNLTPLTLAADGFAADTMDEVSKAFENVFSVYDMSAGLVDEAAQKAFQEWAQNAIINAFSGTDLSFLRIDFDKSDFGGLQQAYAAIQAWNAVQQNIESVIGPSKTLSTTMAAVGAEFDAQIENLRALGWQEEAIAEVEAKRGEYLKKMLYSTSEAFKNFFEPVSEYESTMKTASESFDDLIRTMQELGATQEQVAAVEAKRTEYLWEYSRAMTKAAEQDLHLRNLALGYGTNSMTYGLQSLIYQQQGEREEAKDKYGENSTIYQQLVATQGAEYLKAVIDFLKQQREQAIQAEMDSITDLLGARQDELAALVESIAAKEKEISEAQKLADQFRKTAKALRDARTEIWTGEDNLKGTRYQESYREFNALYEKAMQGDEEALGQLDSKARDLLELGREQLETRGEYNDAFYDIDQKLKHAQQYAEKEADKADEQVAMLQKQLDALNEQKTALEGVIEAIQGQYEQMQAQLDALNQQSGLLEEANMGIDELNVAIALLEATLKSYLQQQLESESGLNAQQKLLQEHANYINSIAYEGRTDWTAEDVYKAIIGGGMTVESWYDKYGKYENGGSYSPYDADAARRAIVANKVAALNAQAYQGRTDWTEQDFYNAIGGNTAENIDKWFREYGINEGISSIYEATELGTEQTIAAFVENLNKLLGQTKTNTNSTNKNLGWAADDINNQAIKNTNLLDFAIGDLENLNSDYWPQMVTGLGGVSGTITGMSGTLSSVLSGMSGTLNSSLVNILNALSKNTSTSKPSGGSSGSSSSGSNTNGYVFSPLVSAGTGVYGSQFQSTSDLLAAKVNQLNAIKYEGRTNWTTQEAAAHIQAAGGYDKWYKEYGKNENLGSYAKSTATSSSSNKTSSSTTTSKPNTATGSSSSTTSKPSTSISTSTNKTGVYGSNYASEQALINAKVAALNASKHDGKSNWTYSEVKNALTSAGGSVQGWYDKWGKAEGFARGGITPINEPFLVGEYGPEMVVSPRQYGILNNETTEAILNRDRPNLGQNYTRDINASLLSMLGDGVNELINIARQQNTKLDRIAADSDRQLALMRTWEAEGIGIAEEAA